MDARTPAPGRRVVMRTEPICICNAIAAADDAPRLRVEEENENEEDDETLPSDEPPTEDDDAVVAAAVGGEEGRLVV